MRPALLALLAVACSSSPRPSPEPAPAPAPAPIVAAPDAADGPCNVRFQLDGVAGLTTCVASCDAAMCEARLPHADETAQRGCDELCRQIWDAPPDTCEGVWDPLPAGAGATATCWETSTAGCPAARPYSGCVYPAPEQRCSCRPRTTPIE